MDNLLTLLGIFFSALSQFIFWAVALFALLRFFHMALQDNTPGSTPIRHTRKRCAWLHSFIALDAAPATTERHPKTPYAKIILFALGVRLALWAIGYIFLSFDGQSPSIWDPFQAFARGD